MGDFTGDLEAQQKAEEAARIFETHQEERYWRTKNAASRQAGLAMIFVGVVGLCWIMVRSIDNQIYSNIYLLALIGTGFGGFLVLSFGYSRKNSNNIFDTLSRAIMGLAVCLVLAMVLYGGLFWALSRG